MKQALETHRYSANAAICRTAAGLSPHALVFLFLLAFCIPLASGPRQHRALRVGVFIEKDITTAPGPDDTRQFSLDVLRVLESSGSLCMPSLVTPAQIQGGALNSLDVVIFPGGFASNQMASLGAEGTEKVRGFVRAGGGYVGICAGAYLARTRPRGSGEMVLNLVPAVLADGNWERGAGLVRVKVTERGERLFPELRGKTHLSFQYINGPVIKKYAAEGLHPYETLMTFDSEIGGSPPAGGIMKRIPRSILSRFRGAPASASMKGTPFMVRTRFGRGRVILASGHPEISQGLQWVLHRMVGYAAGEEAVLPQTGHARQIPPGQQ